MTAMTTRSQFVELRNAFFSALNELHRQLPHASRVAAMTSPTQKDFDLAEQVGKKWSLI